MTEPKSQDQYEIRESDVQAACIELLEEGGWFVHVNSQDRAVRRHASGLTDLIAVRQNVTLFIECKRPGGRLRESQREFRDRVLPHTGTNLYWWLVDDVKELWHVLRMCGLG